MHVKGLIASLVFLISVAQWSFGCVDEHKAGSGAPVSGFQDASLPETNSYGLDTTNDAGENEEKLDKRWHRHRHHHRRKRGLSPIEAIFASKPSRHAARENLRYLTSVPHMAGTKEDEMLAHWMVKELKALGADKSWVDPVDGFMSYPKHRPRLSMFSNSDKNKVIWDAKLEEEILPNDATSNTWYRNHTFNGYSPSGTVRGRLVYANFGTPEDFGVLESFNISVKDRIVLVRYGKCFRGLKAMNAQNRGAIGVVIFSDPHEDGYSVGETYPNGPWRPASSVQRGSVQFNSLCAGDPLRAATRNNTVQKCGYEPEDLYPRVPVLPISYEDALPLLKDLTGPFSPPEFVGTLQVAYKLGPSEHEVLLQTRNRYSIEKIWNAFALFKGVHYGTHRDRPLIIGNHRDAWVFGAVDPNSGTACMLEVARGFGALKKLGWKPRRSIIFASWSGEEVGLVGSTAWGEMQATKILKNAVAYLNVDIGVSGHQFQLETTATLARYIAEVLGDVPDPVIKDKSVLVRWPKEFHPLGTGSDYTVFIHHLGIPSVDMRFTAVSGSGAATSYGVYHSTFDSFSWMEQFGDPTFVFHEKMAVIWGVAALRIADAPILPFNHIDQAKLVVKYIEQVEPIIPSAKVFKELQSAAREFMYASFQITKERYQKHPFWVYEIDSDLNDRLAFAERQFLHEQGLPLRKWFKHVLQAPDLFLGYAAEVLPGIKQAFYHQKDPALTNQQALLVARKVRAVARFLLGKGASVGNDPDVEATSAMIGEKDELSVIA